jgi:hypothetical protein
MSQYARFNTDKREQRIAELREWLFSDEFLAECAMSDRAEKFHKCSVDENPPELWAWRIAATKRNAEVHRTLPEVWAERIAKIEDETTRTMIARIVWWDFFGNRDVANRWPHLDEYLGSANAPQVMSDIEEAEKAFNLAQRAVACASAAYYKSQSHVNKMRLAKCRQARDVAKRDLAAANSRLPAKETLILALHEIGYPPAMARNRIIQGE